jgi:hypothetical protein
MVGVPGLEGLNEEVTLSEREQQGVAGGIRVGRLGHVHSSWRCAMQPLLDDQSRSIGKCNQLK